MVTNLAFLFSTGILEKKEWKTPNSYSNDFEMPPKTPGIYLLIYCDMWDYKKLMTRTVVYVGQSKNLAERYNNHKVLKKLQKELGYIQFHFKQTHTPQEEEKNLIRLIKPKYNIRKYERVQK